MRTATQKIVVPVSPRSPFHTIQNRTPVNTDSIEAITPENDKMVSGVFTNIECPGQPAKITCRYHKGQIFCKTFDDGEKAVVPLSVARHINERCYYEEHSYLLDEQGNSLKTGKKRIRYKFSPEGFSAA